MARPAAATYYGSTYYGYTYQVQWRDQLRLPSTALVAAAAGGHLEVLAFLLDQGAAAGGA